MINILMLSFFAADLLHYYYRIEDCMGDGRRDERLPPDELQKKRGGECHPAWFLSLSQKYRFLHNRLIIGV